MSNWWDSAPVVGQPQSQTAPQPVAPAPSDENWWKGTPVANPADRKAVESGGFLPISRYNDGTWGFDSNAGIVGSIKRAIMLPGDVYTGKIDPMSEEGRSRAMDLAGLASPVNPAVRAGDRAIPGAMKAMEKRMPAPPTQEQLLAQGKRQIDEAVKSGVDYSSQSVANAAAKLRQELQRDGFRPAQAPQTFGLVNDLASPPPNSVANIADIESARRAARLVSGDNIGKADGAAAKRLIQTIDGFLMEPNPSSVVSGPAAAAAQTLRDGRANYAAGKRSETLATISERANRRAASANSGQNLDNSIRSRVTSALERPKISGGFDDAERAALEGVAEGTAVTNTARAVGNLLGGGGGLGAALTGAIGGTAGSVFGPVGIAAGVAAPVVGFASKRAANAMTDRALGRVDALTRTRSPLYQQMQRDTPMTVVSPEQRALIMRMLMQNIGAQTAPAGIRQEY
jgi:hypothetical protein